MIPDRLLEVNAWVLFGLVGQLLFTQRFLVQWIASERMGRSTVPIMFWYLSLVGGSVLFVYALWYRQDPVFTLGQGAGLVVYSRNLILIHRGRKASATTVAQGSPGPGA